VYQVQIPTVADNLRRLSEKERLVLAVELATGVLKLHSTPWLQKRWSKEDIWFLKTLGAVAGRRPRPVDVNQPLVQKSLVSGPALSALNANTTLLRHPNPTLLDLGIVLLELYHGQGIETRRQPENYMANGSLHSNTDLYTARDWLDDSYGQSMRPKYWSAVKHCIDIYVFDPRPKNPDLLDQEFREAVYEKVVIPLQEELDDWNRSYNFGGMY
jgi:hypothetical protein